MGMADEKVSVHVWPVVRGKLQVDELYVTPVGVVVMLVMSALDALFEMVILPV
jgi:hypothetical protein